MYLVLIIVAILIVLLIYVYLASEEGNKRSLIAVTIFCLLLAALVIACIDYYTKHCYYDRKKSWSLLDLFGATLIMERY